MKTKENQVIFIITWVCTGICILLTILSMIKAHRPSRGKPYERLTVEEALRFMSYEPDYRIVDVRDAAAYREGHLEEALNLPLDTIIEDAEKQFEDRAVMLYVYGKDPDESCAGAQKLTDAGFTSVAEVGSYDDWISYHAESETEGLMQGRLE